MSNYFSSFTKHKFINLTTFRKTGVAVSTPVWFAQDGDRLLVRTFTIAWKVKRIGNNPRVQVSLCDMKGKALGPIIEAKARIMSGAECKKADKLLGAKYGLMYKAMPLSARGSASVFIEITPPKE